ncbi:hypothetical protein FACS1894206_09050 [Deltaproteobacteria bacterium]|nr:hypothetical protein FACS1894206_09050 [Deltaproteobacteria bacterium]
MFAALASLPPFSMALVLGGAGVVVTLFGSVLRSALGRTPRRIGNCLCMGGLFLMLIGFLCITSNLSFFSS